ncbi:hypothetical protein G7046_g3413 [Stylonectria norvegica]|nr:hypothetical protein G7046_g3413 [Stylonectria norvegica]
MKANGEMCVWKHDKEQGETAEGRGGWERVGRESSERTNEGVSEREWEREWALSARSGSAMGSVPWYGPCARVHKVGISETRESRERRRRRRRDVAAAVALHGEIPEKVVGDTRPLGSQRRQTAGTRRWRQRSRATGRNTMTPETQGSIAWPVPRLARPTSVQARLTVLTTGASALPAEHSFPGTSQGQARARSVRSLEGPGNVQQRAAGRCREAARASKLRKDPGRVASLKGAGLRCIGFSLGRAMDPPWRPLGVPGLSRLGIRRDSDMPHCGGLGGACRSPKQRTCLSSAGALGHVAKVCENPAWSAKGLPKPMLRAVGFVQGGNSTWRWVIGRGGFIACATGGFWYGAATSWATSCSQVRGAKYRAGTGQ